MLPVEIWSKILQYEENLKLRLVCGMFDDIICADVRKKSSLLILCDYDNELNRMLISHDAGNILREANATYKRKILIFEHDLSAGEKFIHRIKPIGWKIHIVRVGKYLQLVNILDAIPDVGKEYRRMISWLPRGYDYRRIIECYCVIGNIYIHHYNLKVAKDVTMRTRAAN